MKKLLIMALGLVAFTQSYSVTVEEVATILTDAQNTINGVASQVGISIPRQLNEYVLSPAKTIGQLLLDLKELQATLQEAGQAGKNIIYLTKCVSLDKKNPTAIANAKKAGVCPAACVDGKRADCLVAGIDNVRTLLKPLAENIFAESFVDKNGKTRVGIIMTILALAGDPGKDAKDKVQQYVSDPLQKVLELLSQIKKLVKPASQVTQKLDDVPEAPAAPTDIPTELPKRATGYKPAARKA